MHKFLSGRVTKVAGLDLEKNDDFENEIVERPLTIKEIQLKSCDETLLEKYGEDWIEFRDKRRSNKYDKKLVPEIIFELTSTYHRMSLLFLSELIKTSRYTVSQWFNKKEVIDAANEGSVVFHNKMEGIPATIAFCGERLSNKQIRDLALASKLYVKQMQVKLQAGQTDTEEEEPEEIELVKISKKRYNNYNVEKKD